MNKPRHYRYVNGFCGNCAESNEVIEITDWYPAGGNTIPTISICKECLAQMLEEFE